MSGQRRTMSRTAKRSAQADAAKAPSQRRRDQARRLTLGLIGDVAEAVQARTVADRARRVPSRDVLALVLLAWLVDPGRYDADGLDSGHVARVHGGELLDRIADAAGVAATTARLALDWWTARGWLRRDGRRVATGRPMAAAIRRWRDDPPADAERKPDWRRTWAHVDLPELLRRADSEATARGQQRPGARARLQLVHDAVAAGGRGHVGSSQREIADRLRWSARSSVSHSRSVLRDIGMIATGRHRYSTDAGDPEPRRLPDGAALTGDVARLVCDPDAVDRVDDWHRTRAARTRRSTPRRRSLLDARHGEARRRAALRAAGARRRRDAARRRVDHWAVKDPGSDAHRRAVDEMQHAQEDLTAAEADIARLAAPDAAQSTVAAQAAASLASAALQPRSPP